nr:lipid IV(A) 3-deoxy-D-manno-octulosonic acid transferase [Microbulbifer sp. NKW57]
MRLIYTWLLRLSMPFILMRLWWRGRRAPAYRERWRERLGVVPARRGRAKLVWLHSVSVGETLAAVPLIRALRSRNPDWQWLVTTTTPTGSERVRDAFREQLGRNMLHYYAPYDLPECLRRFTTQLRPDLLVVMETELWPNLLRHCDRRQVPALLANARLSEKSARGYARIGGITREMLQSLDRVVAQYQDDGDRFIRLGLPPERLSISGNIKFDLEIPAGLRSEALALADRWRGGSKRPLVLAASTHAGEEEQVLDAFAKVLEERENALLILVPRHPERFGPVAELCRKRGYDVCRRSEGIPPKPEQQVLLGDTMGELLKFFGASDIAFVGGSLVPVGGHNMIEPAAWGVPVICGNHLHNFARVSEMMQRDGAMAVVEDADALAEKILWLLSDDNLRQKVGRRALEVAEANRGALQRLIHEVEALAAR